MAAPARIGQLRFTSRLRSPLSCAAAWLLTRTLEFLASAMQAFAVSTPRGEVMLPSMLIGRGRSSDAMPAIYYRATPGAPISSPASDSSRQVEYRFHGPLPATLIIGRKPEGDGGYGLMMTSSSSSAQMARNVCAAGEVGGLSASLYRAMRRAARNFRCDYDTLMR